MFSDKTWWVTGASSGIGAALAEALAARGANLVLSGRNIGALEDVAKRCGTKVLTLPFEATDFDQIPALVETAWSWAAQTGDRIDGLINNAGISQRSLAVETVFDVYRKIVDVDLLAPIALTQALLPHMIEAGGGNIVGISSVAGIIGAPLRSAYSAAKHGLIGYHDSLRAETAHLGVEVPTCHAMPSTRPRANAASVTRRSKRAWIPGKRHGASWTLSLKVSVN